MMNKYKWFVWSSILCKYIALPYMFCYNRGECPSFILNHLDGGELPPMFSIPMFNVHNFSDL